MKPFTNIIKDIDYFGREFKFSVMGSQKSKTLFGVFISLCCFTLVIVTTILFGRDFFKKQNPRLYTENIKANNFKELTISPSNFILGFRLENYEANLADDPENYFNFNIYHRSHTFNATTQLWSLDVVSLELVPCTEALAPDPRSHKDIVLSEWKCVLYPEQGLKLGGSWNTADFIYDIYFEISNCNSTSCANITEVSSYLENDARYISMFFAEYYFLANDLKSPQNVNYYNFYSELSTSITKFEQKSFKSYILNDDVGWIFQDVRTSSVLAFDKNEANFNFIRIKDEFSKYVYYHVEISYNNDSDKTYRSYMKIQELAALVGGFMKMITFIGNLLCSPYNMFIMSLNLINEYFDDRSEKENQYKIFNTKMKTQEKDMINISPSELEAKQCESIENNFMVSIETFRNTVSILKINSLNYWIFDS